MLEQKLTDDLKIAMLAHDAQRVSVLRGLKSTILYAKVAAGTRESAMPEDEVLMLLSKEAKKRQESADLYIQGGDQTRATAELEEKAIIEIYLPAQLSEAEVAAIVDEVIQEMGSEAVMGKVINAVRAKTSGVADGALIARLVKDKLGL